MKRLLYSLCFIIVILLVVVGCSVYDKTDTQQVSSSEEALEFLKYKGYTIISNDGKVSEYVLKKEDLLELPHQQYWGVQNIDAKDYFGKTIEIYKFTVKNHPLDNYEGNKGRQTIAWVMVCENKVIGGYSFPDVDGLRGGVYSLDGKTLEEVTGLSYQDWLEQWTEKYK